MEADEVQREEPLVAVEHAVGAEDAVVAVAVVAAAVCL